MPFSFDNSYVRLPERFFARVLPTPVAEPRLIRLNATLARQLGLDALSQDEAARIFTGNLIPDGAEPIATAYAGHQFGGFVPQLGDGRAILLGEVIDTSGVRRDIQLKGSGPTPYSRRGDGRAGIGPVLREYLVSEAMAALGIPTTRALAAAWTGENVVREELLPGAVLTRVASSHIRVGTFQFFAAQGDVDGTRILADHVIARHYPAAAQAEQPYLALLEAVIQAQAQLIPQWLLVGFIHGVMNTDNMSIAGETIDFGPCAFLDEFDPEAVFSAIDRQGRYAYANQSTIGQWNLIRLAECFLPLLNADSKIAIEQAESALEKYGPTFQAAYQAGLRRKLGLHEEREGDVELGSDFLKAMAANRADFTLTFRRLADAMVENEPVRSLFKNPADFDAWATRWRDRLEQEPQEAETRRSAMRRVNPLFIPRNHRIEAVIRAAADRNDLEPFEELLTVLSRPFEDQPELAHYSLPPEADERVLQTFCGT